MGRASRLISLLSNDSHAKVFGWIALSGQLVDAELDRCASDVNIERRMLDRIVIRLCSVGVLKRNDAALTIDYARMREIAGLLDEEDVICRKLVGDFQALQAFFDHGELVNYPAKRTRVEALAELLKFLFRPGVRYPESRVNNILKMVNDDYASLRRLLIDFRILDRAQDGRFYWRRVGDIENEIA